MLGEALAGILEALPEEPALDDPFIGVPRARSRRAPLERQATAEVNRQLQGAGSGYRSSGASRTCTTALSVSRAAAVARGLSVVVELAGGPPDSA